MHNKWNCTMYYEVIDILSLIYDNSIGYCKLDNMRCNRKLWSCKQYLKSDETKKYESLREINYENI